MVEDVEVDNLDVMVAELELTLDVMLVDNFDNDVSISDLGRNNENL